MAGMITRLRGALGIGGGKAEADVSYDPVQEEDAPEQGRNAKNAVREYPGFPGKFSAGDSDGPGPAGGP
jgi:hypothetical protein